MAEAAVVSARHSLTKPSPQAEGLAWLLAAYSLTFAVAGLTLRHTAEDWMGLALISYVSVGLVIALKRPGNPIGWLWLAGSLCLSISTFAVAYGTISAASPIPLPGAPILGSTAGTLGNLGFSLVLPFTFLLFPDGKLPSPRWRPVLWLAIANSAVGLLSLFRPGPVLDAPFDNALGIEALGPVLSATKSVYEVAAIALLSLAPVATIVRYRGAALDERLRIKWLAWAAGAIVVVLIFGQGLTFLVQPTGALWQLLLNLTWLLVNVLIITAISIAILAHRLYDVDVVIRKTMVYSVVTFILTLVFLGLVILGQRFLMTLTGEASPVAIVASTLAVAALFSPLRRRVQDAVDRRFYRRKYDAQQVLAGFARLAQHETNQERLARGLTEAVDDAVQPQIIEIWLKER